MYKNYFLLKKFKLIKYSANHVFKQWTALIVLEAKKCIRMYIFSLFGRRRENEGTIYTPHNYYYYYLRCRLEAKVKFLNTESSGQRRIKNLEKTNQLSKLQSILALPLYTKWFRIFKQCMTSLYIYSWNTIRIFIDIIYEIYALIIF